MVVREMTAALLLLGASSVVASADPNVLTYHRTPDRHGAFVVPGLTQAAAANLKPLAGFNGTVSGNVYAQPLFWKPSGAAHGLVIVATENNIVYALDEASGTPVWQTQLAASVPNNQLPCGDINPEGIDGAPVIDPSTGTLYLDALVTTANGVRHYVYALSLTNGAVLSGWPLDVQAALASEGVPFNTPTEGERSALTLFKGGVYVAFGGRAGDCDPYHGVIIRVETANAIIDDSWETRASRGGIWSQGGLAADGNYLFATTGNTENAASWGDGEAIIRLGSTLVHSTAPQNYFTPSNWQTLDADDLDLGGTMAVPIRVPTEAGHSPRALALGKDGNAYLVNRANLGGVGGALAVVKVSTQGIKTAAAVLDQPAATAVAFTNAAGTGSCTGSNLTMLTVTDSQTTPVTTAWCAPFSGAGAPIITTNDGTHNATAWVVGAEGDNQLHGFDVATGKVVFGGAGTGMYNLHRFQTLIVADRTFYVASDGKIYAFTF